MNTVQQARSTFEKYLPLIVAMLAVLLAGKALRRMFWTAFGMYWALRASGVHL